MNSWFSLHGLVVVTGLLVYVIVTHTLRQRRAPAAAIAWVITLALVPYVGLPLFLVFGTRKLVRPRAGMRRRAASPASEGDEAWPQRLAASMDLAPAASYRALRIHADGEQALLALCEVIDSATRTLEICTFILGKDPTADGIRERLERKAREGVKVRLMVDGVGNILAGYPSRKALTAAGVEVAIFVPPIHSPRHGRFNLRNHRKMVIADAERLWCGGRNLAAEYFEGAPGVKAWKDLTFDLEGDFARQARECFEGDWAFATDRAHKSHAAPADASPGPVAQLIPSGPDQIEDTVYSLLVTAFFKSRERIIAVTPYFVPDPTLLMALTLAARRNVAVDLLLPAKSNHPTADISRHRALRDLAAAGARIWFLPQMIHAKAIVVDDTLALAGSANLDARSLFLNFELMVAFYATKDVNRLAAWIEKEIGAAKRYTPRAPGVLRDLAEGLVLWLAFQL